MEKVETGETDIIVPCIRNCGKEINLKNMEDHLSNCPLELVECGWCGLKQSRNVFKQHVKLVNPEKEINNVQQCMQRQCSELSKQQKNQQRQLDDIKNQLTQLNQQNSKFNSKTQQYITWKSLMACVALMLIINFLHTFYHFYWLQSQQAMYSQIDTLNTLKLRLDNHTNEMKPLQEDLRGINDQSNVVVKLNQSIINATKQWRAQLVELERNFTTMAEITDLRSEVNDQSNLIIKLNQTMLNETKNWQKQLIEIEKKFATIAEITDLRSELTDLDKIIDNLSYEIHEQLSNKVNQSSDTDGKIKSPELVDGTCEEKKEQICQNNYKYKNLLEVKLLEQLDNIMLKNSQTLPVVFGLSNFSEKMKNTEEWYSGPFFAFNGGYLMMLEICVSGYGDGKGTHVSVILRLMKGPHDHKLQQSGHWPLRGTFTVELLNQFNDNDHYNCEVIFSTYTCNECTKRVIESDSNFNAKRWGCSKFISHKVIQQKKDSKHLYFNISYNDANPLIPCNQTAPVTLKMSNLSEKINNKEQWYSSPFFAFDGGYQMCLKVYAAGHDTGEGTHLSVYIHLMKGPHDDKLQQSGYWPLRGTFTIKLLNQVSDHHHSINITFSAYTCEECTKRVVKGDITVGWGLPTFLSHDTISYYLKSSSLNFGILYEDNNPPIPCNQTAPITLKMFNLSEKINNKERWYSSPFFAFDGGYQMCLKVYAAGHDTGEGTHLSVYIHLMKGPHDDKLQQSGHWPLRETFTIKLLNQYGGQYNSKKVTFSAYSCEKCTKRVVKNDIGVGCGLPTFLPHDTINYLKSNSLNFGILYEDNILFP